MNPKLLSAVTKLAYWRKQKISKANFLVLVAAVVGVLGGIAAALLKQLTHLIEDFLQNDLHWEYKYYLYLIFPLIGIFLTTLYVKTFIRKDKFKHGLTPILYSISRHSSKISFHNIYSQIITSAITVGFGGSVGVEAPVVYSGSAIGSNLARFFGFNYREVTLLLACGAGAGIAGAFNSPIAGMVFAIEILLPTFSIPVFIPLLISVATASVVARIFYTKPLFVLVTEGWQINALFFYVIMAISIGYFSVLFTKFNYFVKKQFSRIRSTYNRIWIGGLVIGLCIAIFPALYGEGYITIQALLNGHYHSLLGNSFFADYRENAWLLIIFGTLTLFGKSLASLFTVYAGGNGGTFGPSLVMGGFIGFLFSFTVNQVILYLNYTFHLDIALHLNVTNFIVVGMASALSGIMHAPLTGIFLIAEITGSYKLMVPLMLVSAVSYFINKAHTQFSMYTKSLAESGDLFSHEHKESNILRRMKLKYLVEKDFVVLKPDDTPSGRRSDIIHTRRNIFPVVDDDGVLQGLINSEELLEVLVNKSGEEVHAPVSRIMHPSVDSIDINTDMFEVMQQMDSQNIRIFPVVNNRSEYLGFVSKAGIMNKYRELLQRDREFM